LSLEHIHPHYPFMLALSQVTTERLLARALEEAGGTVERGRRLVACRNLEGQVEATLEATSGGTREVATTPWLLAADGARSTAREQLGIDFVGSSLPEPWHLADVPLRTTLADNLGHVFFFDGGGFLFLIRVIDENLHDAPATRWWRVIANQPEPLSRLVQAEVAGPAVWTSSFHIAHRINKSFRVGGVYFAGDAAHIHSPLGARGMNLGLEDAWVFAQLERTGRLDQYDRFRRSLDGQVVRRVEFLSRMAAGETWFFRLVRSVVLPTALTVRFARTLFMRTVTGLDYELPREAVVAPGQAGGKAA
jgi:2-polyprenyl-6-methoxyphenol hydroxylase-like FAD-dependent oxidoreductase